MSGYGLVDDDDENSGVTTTDAFSGMTEGDENYGITSTTDEFSGLFATILFERPTTTPIPIEMITG